MPGLRKLLGLVASSGPLTAQSTQVVQEISGVRRVKGIIVRKAFGVARGALAKVTVGWNRPNVEPSLPAPSIRYL